MDKFIKMHGEFYETALSEIKNGKKETDWMYYIFPQLRGLSLSYLGYVYSFLSAIEVREYMNNELLGNHMINLCSELLKHKDKAIITIFDRTDVIKLKSSITLFNIVCPEYPFFKEILDTFYDGEYDDLTLCLLGVKNDRRKKINEQ